MIRWWVLYTFKVRIDSGNVEKYFLKKFRIMFWRVSRIVSEYHGKI